MKYYVLGFMFTADRESVVLVRKAKPAWQAGKLNGVGGAVEDGEPPVDAMVREFHEETSGDTDPSKWACFGQLILPHDLIFLFRGVDTENKFVSLVRTVTNEDVRVVKVCDLSDGALVQVPNLAWLVHAARDFDPALHMDEHPFAITVVYPT